MRNIVCQSVNVLWGYNQLVNGAVCQLVHDAVNYFVGSVFAGSAYEQLNGIVANCAGIDDHWDANCHYWTAKRLLIDAHAIVAQSAAGIDASICDLNGVGNFVNVSGAQGVNGNDQLWVNHVDDAL